VLITEDLVVFLLRVNSLKVTNWVGLVEVPPGLTVENTVVYGWRHRKRIEEMLPGAAGLNGLGDGVGVFFENSTADCFG
jgi:hypothetical protein